MMWKILCRKIGTSKIKLYCNIRFLGGYYNMILCDRITIKRSKERFLFNLKATIIELVHTILVPDVHLRKEQYSMQKKNLEELILCACGCGQSRTRYNQNGKECFYIM